MGTVRLEYPQSKIRQELIPIDIFLTFSMENSLIRTP
jgi:hypothetical protein